VTVVLPPILVLLGWAACMVIGGVVGAFIGGTVRVATMDTGPDWAWFLLWPLIAVGVVAGWFVGWGLS
jgi:hypothetical protein